METSNNFRIPSFRRRPEFILPFATLGRISTYAEMTVRSVVFRGSQMMKYVLRAVRRSLPSTISPRPVAMRGLLVLTLTLLFDPAATASQPFALHIADDPSTNSMGWSHAFAIRSPDTDAWLFMPLMGHNHDPSTDNSVRVYDPGTDRWVYWQKDLHGQLTSAEWFAGRSTSPPSASGRNNYIGFYLPWEGRGGQLWIAAPGGSLASNNGIYDIAEKRWTHLVPNAQKRRFAPITYTNETANQFVEGWNYADIVCEGRRTLVRYGGKNEGILIIVRPNEKRPGHYLATGYRQQQPGRRTNIRNSGICVDGDVYIFGGTKKWKGKPLREVWKLDVKTLEWSSLPPTPEPIPAMAMVTYDPQRDSAVIVFGDNTKRVGLYNLKSGAYDDLTGALNLPIAHNTTGAYLPGSGHLYRGGTWGKGGWESARQIWCVSVNSGDTCGRTKHGDR